MSDHPTIRVLPDHLRALGGSVSRCAQPAASSARAVRGLAELSTFTPVGPALADFRIGWSRLLAIVADDTARCGLAVLAAADAWEAQEGALTTALARSGGRTPA
jgi:hypothetical protein